MRTESTLSRANASQDSPRHRKLGRPRSATCHTASLRAAMALLRTDRYADITMEGIAQRAGVSKQTLYKWWPSKAHLVMEAYAELVKTTLPIPDTGNLKSDLELLMLDTCAELSRGNFGATMAGLIAEAQNDAELEAQLRTTFIFLRRTRASRVLERGVLRGELPEGLDLTFVLDLFYGPMWHRLLLRHAPLDRAFAHSVVDALLACFGTKGALK